MIGHEYSIEQLKSYFETGDKPNEIEFARFIQECYNNDEEVIDYLKTWSLEAIQNLKDYVDEQDEYIISLINGLAARMGSDFDVTFNVGGTTIGTHINSGDTVQSVVKNILYKTFSGATDQLPSLSLSASTSFDTYEACTVLSSVKLSTTYTDGTFITWTSATESATTPSNCLSNSYYPIYYIDGTAASSSVAQYTTNITIKQPTTVYESAVTDIYATKAYKKSTTVVYNSDLTENPSIYYPASMCTSEHHQYVGAYKYFWGYTTKAGISGITSSSTIRNLGNSGFVMGDGADVTEFNERYTTATDGSQYYVVVAVPVGYYVTVDNEASMDVPMRDSGDAVYAVNLGGGTSSTTQAYKLYYTAFNGAAFRNLRINKES